MLRKIYISIIMFRYAAIFFLSDANIICNILYILTTVMIFKTKLYFYTLFYILIGR